MDAALLQRFLPEEYHRRFLADGVRPDGRAQHDRRPARLRAGAAGSAHGSASVCLGQSAAVVGIRAEVCEATPDTPALGSIVATVDLPPLCSVAMRDRHRSAGVANFLSTALSDVLNSPHVLDATQLNIRDGELFWMLHIHTVCLNYDGNAFDLCLLAAVAALEDLSLPSLGEEPSGRLMEVLPDSQGSVFEGKRLALKSRPLPATFAQLPGDVWVLDPTHSEESLGASVSLCLVGGKWLIYHQGGGASADRFLKELMPAARVSVPVLTALLDAAGAPGSEDACGGLPTL